MNGAPAERFASLPKTASDADQPRVCVRCGASSSTDAPLIATPEGWMCERCYADAN